MKRNVFIGLLLGGFCTSTGLAQMPVGTAFTYQGQLKEGGLPFTGSANLRFQLYDADAGGMLVGTNSVPNVPINNGLFTVTLDFGGEAFFGDARWLEIAVYQVGVGYVTLTPRQPLTAAPYALYALSGGGGGSLWSPSGNDIYYATGDVGVGTVNPLYPLHTAGAGPITTYTENTAPGGTALYATAGGTTARGIYTQATAGSGITYGLEAYAQSPDGFALYGFNEADSGSANAVRGECGSPDGIAIYGWAYNDSGTGSTIGVKGQIANANGAAVYGEASATTGTASGVYGESASPDGRGVVGLASSWDPGDAAGVYGESFGWNSAGVCGKMSNEFSLGAGVKGEMGDSTGYLGHLIGGVYGTSSDAAGVTGFSSNWHGVVGEAGTAGGAGVWGTRRDSGNVGQLGTADSGVTGETQAREYYGVYGVNHGTTGMGGGSGVYGVAYAAEGVGVKGLALGTTGGAVGVSGFTWCDDGTGVYGSSGSTSGNTSGVLGRVNHGTGVRGEAINASGVNYGVHGSSSSSNGYGVYGIASGSGTGVYGKSTGGYGVHGYSTSDWSVAGISPQNSGQAGVVGAIINHTGGVLWKSNSGVSGSCEDGQGVAGRTFSGVGIWGEQLDSGNVGQLATSTEGVHGQSSDGDGVMGVSLNGRGVVGVSTNGRGVMGSSTDDVAGRFNITNDGNSNNALEAVTPGNGSALYAESTRAGSDAPAVYGKHAVSDYYGIGVKGEGGYRGVEGRVTATGSSQYTAVWGYAGGGTGTCLGLHGQAFGGGTNYGVYGLASGGTTNYAGFFAGNVHVTGTLSKGGGSFKIDHPLDPENKYLLHSFVESPDMMNVYNGNIVTDEKGYATVKLPKWFETLNRDFRYQLTVLGQFAQAIVAEKIHDNQFVIRTDKPSVEVSWQVTGIRHDLFAEANRIPVEQDKPAEERGTYLHPEARGLSADLQVDRVMEARAEAAKQKTVNQADEHTQQLPEPAAN